MLVVQLNPTAARVMELVEPHVARQGFELVGVEFLKGTRHSILRLLVDKPEGGVSLDDLESLSPMIGDLLDVYDPVEGRYTLEMASPGINRPLTRLKDFEAHVGKLVKIRIRQPREGRRNFEGALAAVSTNGIELDDILSKSRQRFAFDEIKGANYEHKFD